MTRAAHCHLRGKHRCHRRSTCHARFSGRRTRHQRQRSRHPRFKAPQSGLAQAHSWVSVTRMPVCCRLASASCTRRVSSRWSFRHCNGWSDCPQASRRRSRSISPRSRRHLARLGIPAILPVVRHGPTSIGFESVMRIFWARVRRTPSTCCAASVVGRRQKWSPTSNQISTTRPAACCSTIRLLWNSAANTRKRSPAVAKPSVIPCNAAA